MYRRGPRFSHRLVAKSWRHLVELRRLGAPDCAIKGQQILILQRLGYLTRERANDLRQRLVYRA